MVPVAKGFEPVIVLVSVDASATKTGPKKVMPSANAIERLVVQRNRQDLK